ncbi:hypothetical protein BH10CYA1_BH10CYA1_28640 [soil metagenome]
MRLTFIYDNGVTSTQLWVYADTRALMFTSAYNVNDVKSLLVGLASDYYLARS